LWKRGEWNGMVGTEEGSVDLGRYFSVLSVVSLSFQLTEPRVPASKQETHALIQCEVISEPIRYANQAQQNPSAENCIVMFSNPVPASSRLGHDSGEP
jgi:hypothetical protein